MPVPKPLYRASNKPDPYDNETPYKIVKVSSKRAIAKATTEEHASRIAESLNATELMASVITQQHALRLRCYQPLLLAGMKLVILPDGLLPYIAIDCNGISQLVQAESILYPDPSLGLKQLMVDTYSEELVANLMLAMQEDLELGNCRRKALAEPEAEAEEQEASPDKAVEMIDTALLPDWPFPSSPKLSDVGQTH